MSDFRETLCRLFIKERHVYLQFDSEFRVKGKAETGTKKAKFKLFCRKTPFDLYFFYTTNSNSEKLEPELTIEVSPSDWDYEDGKTFHTSQSYICINHYDVMPFSMILTSYLTSNFKYVALLSEAKFQELRNLYTTAKLKLSAQRLKKETTNIADFALLGVDFQEELNEVVGRLGLS